MPELDEKFLERLEELLKPHESGISKIGTWLSALIPLGVILITVITFYVLTNDRLARLEAAHNKIDDTAEVARDKANELKLEVERLKVRLDRVEKR